MFRSIRFDNAAVEPARDVRVRSLAAHLTKGLNQMAGRIQGKKKPKTRLVDNDVAVGNCSTGGLDLHIGRPMDSDRRVTKMVSVKVWLNLDLEISRGLARCPSRSYPQERDGVKLWTG
jgi:hypothetical protein